MARLGRVLAVLSLVGGGGCSRPRLDTSTPEPRGTKSRATLVFSYSASDGEFSYLLTLKSNRRWTRSEHSGSATPKGRLSPAAMRRFLALLDAAPFEERMTESCHLPVIGDAHYQDHRNDRSARDEMAFDPEQGWIPCGLQTDEVTERVVSCLEALTDRRATDACRIDSSG